MTRRTLLQTIDSHELSEWEAVFIMEVEDAMRAEVEAKARTGATARVRKPRRRR